MLFWVSMISEAGEVQVHRSKSAPCLPRQDFREVAAEVHLMMLL